MWGEVRGYLMCRDAPCGHPVPYERFLLAAILSMDFWMRLARVSGFFAPSIHSTYSFL